MIEFALMLCMLCSSVVWGQSDTLTSRPADTVAYQYVDEQASFPGGEQEMYRYIVANLKYPDLAREEGVQGLVYVEFVVEADGRLTNVSVRYGPHPLLDSAAVAMVRGMPRWIPGKKDGEVVRSMFVIPIQFQLHRNTRKNDRQARKRSRTR